MTKKKNKSYKFVNKFVRYIMSNRLFISYCFLSLIGSVLIRTFTVSNTFDYKPLIVDLALILIIGAFGYLFKGKKQFRYYFTWIIIFNVINIINSIYYTFYVSFASVGLLASISQVGDVADSLVEKLKLTDFIYILIPILFYYIHKILNKDNYYIFMKKIENGKKMCVNTILIGVLLLACTLVTMTKTDYSRLAKQWNREYIVERFGIIMYQGNDIVQSLYPKINSLFGYDEAARKFKEFYQKKNSEEKKTNEYTNIFEGKNIIFVHMESMQAFLMDLEFNGEAVVPTVRELASEGMFFSKFYPQISVGTSSDTEFTLNTSLMPANSGTVFVSYYNRNYVTIEKLLKEKGYYTFSMHGNKADMWNRSKMHPQMGYDDMFFKESFNVSEENTTGLGINDYAFFEQAMPILRNIENKHEKYMGTILTLSNHSPFNDLAKYGDYDLTYTTKTIDEETGKEKEEKIDYLKDTKMGNYIKSAHYADGALKEFIEYIKNDELFNNTVFVFYGDHEAKLSKSEFEYLYNYDKETGKVKTEEDEGYYNYDYYANELNKNTPLIIWTKDEKLRKKINKEVTYYMGMYDVLPTIGNMMGFSSKYALGHDIFDIKDDNIVIFPNSNFLTSKVYYNNSTGLYLPLQNVALESDYIDKYKTYTEEYLDISNNIIVHDLIEKEGQNIDSVDTK